MVILYNIILFVCLFVILKTIQIAWSFGYTTYKSITIHKSLEHAFTPGLGYRLRSGLLGDIAYFIAGILVTILSEEIRALFSAS
jgi:hypothetical protein